MECNILNIGNECVGCRSCEQACPVNCISFGENEEGFIYPVVDNNKCVNCGVCLKKCPSAVESKYNVPLETYGLKNKNQDRIMNSASGGASDVMAQYIIDNGGVVFGCAYTENLKVKHIEVTEKEDLEKLQSSKYVQSDTLNCYSKVKEELETGKKVLFTGTPCQIDGLYSFLGNNRQHENLCTIDIICHGVPSPLLLEKYFSYMERKLKQPILKYNFRSKEKHGWGTQYLLKTNTKTKTKMLSLDKYGKSFLHGDCYRECCYMCKYSCTNRVSDITIGDFWGVQKCHPEFFSSKGVSSVIVNTEKGQNLIRNIADKVELISCTIDEVKIKQGNLISPTRRPEERESFYKNFGDDNFFDKLKVGICFKERIKSIIPSFIVQKLKSL